MIDKLFLKDDNYIITDCNEICNKVEINIKSKKEKCKCPKCGMISETYHGTYTRKIQDVPIHNVGTWLIVSSYEFKCLNENCDVKTFTEELPFARKSKVKTDSLIQLILGISIFLSATSASLVMSFLGVKVSADTIGNIVKKIKVVDKPDIKAVGIDDVAIRKGQTYATAIYDMEDHHLLALLEGRDADSVKKWLENHPKIEIVARDRANAYATAINEILPNCMQVADRYHLFENLISHLKDVFYAEVPEKIFVEDDKIIEKAKKVPEYLSNIDESKLDSFDYDNTPPKDNYGNIITFDNKKRDLDSEQYKRQKDGRVKKKQFIITLREEAEKLSLKTMKEKVEFASKYNISYVSLLKYLKMSEEEVDNLDKLKGFKKSKTKMDNYCNIIYKMLKDGIKPNYIAAYIIKLGCDASHRYIRDYINLIGKNNNMNYENNIGSQVKMQYPNSITVITRYDLLKCILTLDDKKKDKEILKYLDLIKEKYPIVNQVETIFKDFHSTMFSKDTEMLDIFIGLYSEVLPTFCNGLKKDIAPVKNAISYTINSGFVEGNNNKFKLIKRIVYGKQNLVNLFKKSYLCFLATTDSFDIEDIVDGVLSDEEK